MNEIKLRRMGDVNLSKRGVYTHLIYMGSSYLIDCIKESLCEWLDSESQKVDIHTASVDNPHISYKLDTPKVMQKNLDDDIKPELQLVIDLRLTTGLCPEEDRLEALTDYIVKFEDKLGAFIHDYNTRETREREEELDDDLEEKMSEKDIICETRGQVRLL
jgi:hypothetical protein